MKTATIFNINVQAQPQAAVRAQMFINAPRKHDNTPSNALLEIWKS